MIEFRSTQLVARFLKPGSDERAEAVSEVRWDPLTRRTMRISSPRPFVPGPVRPPDELPPEVLEADRCPFCRDLALACPGLDPTWSPERQMRRGEATLFPNLFPYGTFSAVIALTKAHHVPIGAFTPSQLVDGLALARDYVARVVAAAPEARYVNVTWNLLPSSGGTLVHPHFQVNADPVPTNGLRENQEAARAFRARHGTGFWPTLVAEERRLGMRFLGDVGTSAWMTPFAPQAHLEVWGVVPGRTAIAALTDDDVEGLAAGLANVLQAYARAGRNALNMALEADEGAGDDPSVRLRLAVRSSYRPWYRSDQTHFDVVLEECATIIAPETAAALLRPAFGAPDTLETDRRA